MSRAKEYTSKISKEILKKLTPAEVRKIENRMLLATRIDDALKTKGWKKKDLADALRKQPSEITKWLSGTHNFTTDTLWDIERVLGIELIRLEEKHKEQVTKFYGTISKSNENIETSKYDYYNPLLHLNKSTLSLQGERSSSDVIVGLDIGNTKICVIVGRTNEFGKIEVLGLGQSESLGIMRGVVANIDKTVTAIKTAVERAESMTGIAIKNVIVGIGGQHIKSLQHRGILVRRRSQHDSEISKVDIHRLTRQLYRLWLGPSEKIIHVIPQEFIVDNKSGVKNPVGMTGIRLEANFHIITGHISAAQNICKCVENAGLKLIDIVPQSIASSNSVLSNEEKTAGVALVDIGGDITDIAIFQDNIIRHVASIPFGGNIITDDIKEGCRVPQNVAETLKITYGSALVNETKDRIIDLPTLKNIKISSCTLESIIQARMEEILEHVYFEIKSLGFERKLIAGIVLTGGGAQLRKLVQLVEYVTGLDARIGYPSECLANNNIGEITNPIYATAIGLLIKNLIGIQEIKNTSEKSEWYSAEQHNVS